RRVFAPGQESPARLVPRIRRDRHGRCASAGVGGRRYRVPVTELISVRGARENNLRGVDVHIPKRQLSVFTGVSGSGTSSLVCGTLAAESRRLIDETYDAFVQGFMPPAPQAEVDSLEGLTAAILVGQDQMGA